MGQTVAMKRAPSGARLFRPRWAGVLVVELLRGVALYQEITVVERLEVNLDDISTGVVDPHVLNSNHHH